MDFAAVVNSYGEETIQRATFQVVTRIREILQYRTWSAVNGVVTLTIEELQEDAVKVARELDEFPLSAEEKCVVIQKAWELIGP